MELICQFKATLPQTKDGEVCITIEKIANHRHLTSALREIYIIQNRYPLNGPRLSILCDGQEVGSGEIVEGPREHKNQRPALFLRTEEKTWAIKDWMDYLAKSPVAS